MKSFSFFFLLVFFVFDGFSQKTIVLKTEKLRINTDLFHIVGVKDGRTKKGSIGSIFTENGEKQAVLVNNGIKNAFQNFIKKSLSADTSTSKILYHVKAIKLSEKKKTDYEINGKIELLVSFEKINEEDTLALVEESFEKSYIRSSGKDDIDNFEPLLRQLLGQSLAYFGGWLEINHPNHEAFLKSSKIEFLPDLQTEDADTLCYGVREITWEDFRGKPLAYSRFGGAIFPNISYSADFSIQKNELIVKIQTRVYMIKAMSWIKADQKNDYTLMHEKIHFAIAKVIIERFKKKVSEMQATNVADLSSMIQLQYLDSYREMNKLQEQYDEETKHGQNTEEQKKWEILIKDL